MPSPRLRTTAPETPRPLSAGEITKRLDALRDELSLAADAARPDAPRILPPAVLLRCLASLTSRN